MKRLGPELKMPDLEVPDAVKDLYYDLHDRRLLPLVGLVLVAIVAAPFLLGGSSEEAPPPPVAQAQGSAALEGAEASSLTVVQSTPGLRDYRKRLARRQPTNPFKQRFTHVDLSGAQLNPQTESSAETTITSTTSTSSVELPESSPETTAPSPESSSDGGLPPSGGNGDERLTFYTFAIEVRIAQNGGKGRESKQEPVERERVLPLTPLPGEKAPVVTYMGASKKGKALLMISNEVKSTFGDAKCVSGEEVCQLLEVESGQPTTFVYGYNEVRYTINVLKIYPVVTGATDSQR